MCKDQRKRATEKELVELKSYIESSYSIDIQQILCRYKFDGRDLLNIPCLGKYIDGYTIFFKEMLYYQNLKDWEINKIIRAKALANNTLRKLLLQYGNIPMSLIQSNERALIIDFSDILDIIVHRTKDMDYTFMSSMYNMASMRFGISDTVFWMYVLDIGQVNPGNQYNITLTESEMDKLIPISLHDSAIELLNIVKGPITNAEDDTVTISRKEFSDLALNGLDYSELDVELFKLLYNDDEFDWVDFIYNNATTSLDIEKYEGFQLSIPDEYKEFKDVITSKYEEYKADIFEHWLFDVEEDVVDLDKTILKNLCEEYGYDFEDIDFD